MTTEDPTQAELLPELVRSTARKAREQSQARRRGSAKPAPEPAAELPVARVLVDVSLAHLDRSFDYAVPASMDEGVRPGVRVKVRFAGQDVDGYVLARVAETDHTGALAPIRRLVSPEPVLHPQIAELLGTLATRYAGVRADLVRLAVPPRHAATEKEPPQSSQPRPAGSAGTGGPVPEARTDAPDPWRDYPGYSGYATALREGRAPRAVWSTAPADDWPRMIALAVQACAASGRGAVVCLPDVRDVARVEQALSELIGADAFVTLTGQRGPAARYRAFLRVSRGECRVVVGTRSAAFAPVADPGLFVIWDDGDDLHAEPRAPYPHTREVLLTRADSCGAGMLLGGFARSAEAHYLLRTGWAHELAVPRAELRARARVQVPGSDRDLHQDPYARHARIPKVAHDLIRDALGQGPVLVQVPRAGYLASLACESCRTPARCGRCQGPLQLPEAYAAPTCRWCGETSAGWACEVCGARGLRSPQVGQSRTAEELGRSFPGVPVVSATAEHPVETVGEKPGLVVATPGAEPPAVPGYAAVLLLDGWVPLARVGLRAGEEALRRWANAAGTVRRGGTVVLVADGGHPAVQALVRWDPGGFAEREIAERSQAHLPPATRLATVGGALPAVEDFLDSPDLPAVIEVLGPVPAGEEDVRAVLRVPRRHGAELSAALGLRQRQRSARKAEPVRVQVDPVDLG